MTDEAALISTTLHIIFWLLAANATGLAVMLALFEGED